MVVHTKSERALRLQRSALQLILSTHHLDCGHCGKNKRCALQRIARHLKVPLKSRRLPLIGRNRARDESHPLFTYDPDKCVLCEKCVWVCKEKAGVGTLQFAYRGFDTVLTTFDNQPFGRAECSQCLQCVEVCPVGALLPKTPTP
jgi:formate dehydrogenase major subunit/NADH-quinone oxidoreductase subunit G